MEFFAFSFLALLFVAFFTREVIAPASRNTCDRRWLIFAGALGIATAIVTLGIGYLFAAEIRSHALLRAGRFLPDLFVGLLSFLLTSFIFYWWHRATHRFDLLWRVFHQLHSCGTAPSARFRS